MFDLQPLRHTSTLPIPAVRETLVATLTVEYNPVIGPSARRCLLEHPLVGADQVPRRLAEDGATAILHSAPEVFVTPCPAPRRIVRRADDVREVEKRVTHREAAVPHRLHPPRIDPGEKVRMGDKMRV